MKKESKNSVKESPVDFEETETVEDSKLENKLVVWNDDVNSFESVIHALVTICKLEYEFAVQFTYIIHYRGKCIVQSGDEKKLKPMKEGLDDRGISATIES